jgi:hypothetical protein
MILRYLISFGAFLITQGTWAQNPAMEWQSSFGGSGQEDASAIRQTSDGGYIVAGESSSNDFDVSENNGMHDFWLLKIDSVGALVWQNSFGGSNMERAHDLEQTSDGGYIVVGEAASNDGDLTHNNGERDFWVVKVNASGDLIWQKSYGGSAGDIARTVLQTSDGGYIVAGETASSDGDIGINNGAMDFWILRLDSLGEMVWEKSFGGSGWDSAESICATSDGAFLVVGGSESSDGDLTLNQGDKDYWAVKIDTNGNLLWQKSLGGSDWDLAYSVQQTLDGGYILAGESRSSDGDVDQSHKMESGPSPFYRAHGNRDYWIVKLDSAGTIGWQWLFGGSDWDAGRSVHETLDEGYIVAGFSNSTDVDVTGNNGNWDFWLVRLNYSGDIMWQTSLGGSAHDLAQSVRQTNDGGYVVAGSAWSNDDDLTQNYGASDIWIVKLGVTVGLEELAPTHKRERIRVLNLLGQVCEDKPNTLLIHVYSDGSTEKVFRLE